MITLDALMKPLTVLPKVAPLSQVCDNCPPSWAGSASAGGVVAGSTQAPLTGVHAGVGGGGEDWASSKSELTTKGATRGSGRHELAMRGEEGEQRSKSLVVTNPSLKT